MAKPDRRRRSSRRARRRGRPVPRRRLLLGGLLLTAIVCLPAGRHLAAGAWHRLEQSIAAARAEGALQREHARYAHRYGISREMSAAVYDAALAEGVEPDVAFRLVRVESGFVEAAVSPVGALGLTQLMPATAAELQPGIARDEILLRDTNLRLGLRYFGSLLRYYDGDVEEALHAYNRGPGTVARIRAGGGDPANGYARKVLGATGASPVTAPGAEIDSAAAPPLHELPAARLPAGM